MNETEKIALPKLAMDDLKKTIIDHMNEYHSQGIPYGTKKDKGQLLRRHAALHNNHRYTILHTHVDLSSEEQIQFHLDLGKPLSGGQRVTLEKLINNDFAKLENELRAMAREASTAKQAEVEKQFTSRIAEAKERIRAITGILDEARRRITSLVYSNEDISVSGWNLDNSLRLPVSIEVKGLAAARKAADDEVQNELHRALALLQRQRLSALRVVLEACIEPEARQILDQIPSAETLMKDAMVKELEAAKPPIS